ncbi:MAG: antitoxin family protein [Chloroflexi bacterium]|nr:antitoxin family protein [Chloroflexota bacterium]
MLQTIEAAYEDGFKPLQKVRFTEHQRVWLTVLTKKLSVPSERSEPVLPSPAERVALVRANFGIVAVSNPAWADWVTLGDEVLEEN